MKSNISSYFKVSSVNILALLLIIDSSLIILKHSLTFYYRGSLPLENLKLIYDFFTALISFLFAFFLLYRHNWARLAVTVIMILSVSEGLNGAIETYLKMSQFFEEDARDFILPELIKQSLVCAVAIWFLLKLNSAKIISEFHENIRLDLIRLPSVKTFVKGTLFTIVAFVLILNIKYLVTNDYYFMYFHDSDYVNIHVPIYEDKSERSNVIANIQTYVPFFLISIENDLMGGEWYRIVTKSGKSGFLLTNRKKEMVVSHYTYKDIVTCNIIRIYNWALH